MPRPRLSLCMVVRNEAERLPGCLKALKAAVDEIVVVDTGSKDATPRIALASGARLLRTKWQDDFRAPRELSFRAATGDWILFLDADERISPRDLPRLRGLMRHADAWRFEQRTYGGGWTTLGGNALIVRLFRNLPGLRTSNRVHADVAPWLQARRLHIRQAPFSLHHRQDRSPAAMRRRLAAYLRMNRLQVREDPSDAWAWRDLGALQIRRDPAEACRCLRKSLALRPDVEAERLLALARMAAAGR